MYLIFDTETTGLPKNWNAPATDTDNWPRCVQIAWQLHDAFGQLVEHRSFLVKPEGFNIPFDAEKIHGISTELAKQEGLPIQEIIVEFNLVLAKTKFFVGQNLGFDLNIVGCEFHRLGIENILTKFPVLDTCTEKTAELCQLTGGRGGKFKLPTLSELYRKLFGASFDEAHNATADVEATTRCFFELIRTNHFTPQELQSDENYLSEFISKNSGTIQNYGLIHQNLKALSQSIKQNNASQNEAKIIDISGNSERLAQVEFSHLHNHSQYSILQSTIEIKKLIKRAGDLNCPAVALTDTGNMMAAFVFVKEVIKYNEGIEEQVAKALEKGETFSKKKLLAIVGCEFNVCRDLTEKSNKDNGYQVVFLAKNKKGYHNLAKLASYAYTAGFYYVPRIDRNIIEQYKEDLIVLTGGLTGEIPNLILNVGENQAEEALLWWKEKFGADLYIEIIRHGFEEENRVNETLLKFHQKHNIEIVAANSNFYLDKKDANAHDILLCIKDGELKSTPIGSGRGFRYGLKNEEFYFKSPDEMKKLFADLPEAIENTNKIVEKCESYTLARKTLLPAFVIPQEFEDVQDKEDGGKRGENNFLRHLTYKGAEKRWGTLSQELRDRLDFELATISNTGYPGYFLIVQDFCQAARDMGVSVGPGRGSAAGSAVAYCTGITNVDPIKYDLLFERFLNPERVSLPDIDIDFDDEGRQKVIDWVINKYGSKQVAQIITYGTMAAKSSIRDTARVLDLPLHEADKLAKLVSDISLNQTMNLTTVELAEKFKNNPDDLSKANELRTIAKGKDLRSEVVNQAVLLEGSMRNTGTHACGVIITPDDMVKFVPVTKAKDSDMLVTQFDNSVAESAGLLKMDFLGLRTLTIIKDAVSYIKQNHDIDLDIDIIPLDDQKTYELFQRGETNAVFQYESAGMQKSLKDLKPDSFNDLIAMNALYRPGPIAYIPNYINRKHGKEPITFDLEGMDEFLGETYGITVYQEQVMRLSQKLANFTKGDADTLRKAMGKKDRATLDKMKGKFIDNCKSNGHDTAVAEKVWKDWEAFASYAFNKSHSTCYAYVAFQTAYIKAHYPSEFMASVLNHASSIDSISFLMEECKRMGVKVLGPDINEGFAKFSVIPGGSNIRFGMASIKGVGENTVENIIAERNTNGVYTSVFDLAKRLDSKSVNKKSLEGLALAGGFDSFENMHRAMFFTVDLDGQTLTDRMIKYSNQMSLGNDSSQASLFGGDDEIEITEPQLPNKIEPWSKLEELAREKEVVGFFISGHPLDPYKLIIDNKCNANCAVLKANIESFKGKDIVFGGIITGSEQRISKTGNAFGKLIVEDYHGAIELMLFGKDFVEYNKFMVNSLFVYVKAKVQERYGQPGSLEIKIQKIELLENVKENIFSTMKLKLDVNAINEQLIEKIETIFSTSQGKCSIEFLVEDAAENLNVKLFSKSHKIAVSTEIINELDKIGSLTYELN